MSVDCSPQATAFFNDTEKTANAPLPKVTRDVYIVFIDPTPAKSRTATPHRRELHSIPPFIECIALYAQEVNQVTLSFEWKVNTPGIPNTINLKCGRYIVDYGQSC